MSTKFITMNDTELVNIDGGEMDVFGFASDIYDSWCDMWHDFGANIYHAVND